MGCSCNDNRTWQDLLTEVLCQQLDGGDTPEIQVSQSPLGCVVDAAGDLIGKVFLCKVTDEETGVSSFSNTYVGLDGTITEGYTGTWEDCAPEGGDTSLITVCACDDVNGDGSEYTNYIQAFAVTLDNGVIESIDLGSFTDVALATPYTPSNPVDCNSIGTIAVEQQGRICLEGSTWSPTHIIKSYTVRVHSVSDINNPPTFTDSFGNTTALYSGERFSYCFESESVDISPTVTAQAGDKIIITYIIQN